MRMFFSIVLLGMLICGACQDETIGFLNTTYSEYKPDSLVVKKNLTEDDWENEPQYKYKADWVSAPLQGFTGTPPIYITIDKVVSPDGGDAEIFVKETVLRGNGAFVIPVENTIPVGHYVISLQLKNEGYFKVLDSIFTVIVK